MSRSISDLPEDQEKPDPVTMEKLADMMYSVFLAVKDLEDKIESNTTEMKRINGL